MLTNCYSDFFFLTVQWLTINATTTTTCITKSNETMASELKGKLVPQTEVESSELTDNTGLNVKSQRIVP